MTDSLVHKLTFAKRLLAQQSKGSNKLYSSHASEVECISKGKAHKHYEFRVKVGVVASLRTPFILAAHSLPGNPYHGHTLALSLAHTGLNTGAPIKTAAVDKGYRVPRVAWRLGVEVVIPGQQSKDEAHRQRCRRGPDRPHEERRTRGSQLAKGPFRQCHPHGALCRRSESVLDPEGDRRL